MTPGAVPPGTPPTTGPSAGPTLDAAADAGNRWIFPELIAEQGLQPWNGVRWVAVAGSTTPTHAVDATAGLERSISSLLEHRSYIEVLTDQDPEKYCRTFLTGYAQAAAARFGRPARRDLRAVRPLTSTGRAPPGIRWAVIIR